MLFIWAPENLKYFMNFCLRRTKTRLANSGLLNDMGNSAFSPAGQPMCIYGRDPAYPLRIHPQAPYHQGRLTMASRNCQKPFNFLETRLKFMLARSSYRNCRLSYVWRWSSSVEKAPVLPTDC